MTETQILLMCLSIIGALIAFIANRIANDLSRLTESVQELNSSMAVVVKQVESHEKRLDRLEKTP